MTQVEFAELKPCPSCQGEPRKVVVHRTEFDEDFAVRCTKCGLQTQPKCFPHLAQEAWNNRPYIDALCEEITELGEVAKGCAKRERLALEARIPQEDEVERLRKALEPFAKFNLDGFDGPVMEVVPPWSENPASRIEPIYKEYFLRARAAIAAQP